MNEELIESKPLEVLIVGCGNIAGGFDQSRNPDVLPYTHAGAYVRDNRFNMVACIEPDEIRRIEFMKVWDIPEGFSSFEILLDTGKLFDVISICSPTTNHVFDLEATLQLKPKLIFCEKPVTTSLAETERLVDEYRKANVPFAVNYTRRWDPDISKLREGIQSGKWGQLRSVIGTYNKGILNNGSHMVDLLYLLLGSMKIVKAGVPVHDYFEDDPTIPVWLEGYQGLPIHLACGHADDYSLFELQLVFSQGVLTMEDGGMRWRERLAKESAIFKGYQILDEGVRRPGLYPHAMLEAVDNIHGAIRQGEQLASTGESALAAQRLCEQIKHLACNSSTM